MDDWIGEYFLKECKANTFVRDEIHRHFKLFDFSANNTVPKRFREPGQVKHTFTSVMYSKTIITNHHVKYDGVFLACHSNISGHYLYSVIPSLPFFINFRGSVAVGLMTSFIIVSLAIPAHSSVNHMSITSSSLIPV